MFTELVQAAVGTSARDDRIVQFHHDDDTGFRGVVSEYATERGWRDTHTGGYNPNANSLAERRIGMLHQLFRTVLLAATGGHMYDEQLWGRGLVYCSWVLDHCEWSDRVSPMSYLADAVVDLPSERHVFGAYVLYRVDSEQCAGKWQPAAEMGIWVGLSPDVRHGHLIVPIRWNAAEQYWELLATVTAVTVRVFDDVMPLRRVPADGVYGSQSFDTFVDAVMNPLFAPEPIGVPVVASDASLGVVDEASVESTVESTNDSHSSGEHQRSVVERLKKKSSRVRDGVTQYLVKWAGYNNRYNCWRDLCDLQCDDLIADFESHSALNAVAVPGESAAHGVLQTDAEVDRQSVVVFGEADCDAVIAVRRLMNRQGLEGTVADYLPGYKKEVRNVIRRRLVLQDSETAEQVRRDHQVGRLRMLLSRA